MPVQDRVRRPRHFIVYRHDEHQLEVVRLLHDAMDLPEQFN
jgi:plasmid stabilization system protein ParE